MSALAHLVFIHSRIWLRMHCQAGGRARRAADELGDSQQAHGAPCAPCRRSSANHCCSRPAHLVTQVGEIRPGGVGWVAHAAAGQPNNVVANHGPVCVPHRHHQRSTCTIEARFAWLGQRSSRAGHEQRVHVGSPEPASRPPTFVIGAGALQHRAAARTEAVGPGGIRFVLCRRAGLHRERSVAARREGAGPPCSGLVRRSTGIRHAPPLCTPCAPRPPRPAHLTWPWCWIPAARLWPTRPPPPGQCARWAAWHSASRWACARVRAVPRPTCCCSWAHGILARADLPLQHNTSGLGWRAGAERKPGRTGSSLKRLEQEVSSTLERRWVAGATLAAK